MLIFWYNDRGGEDMGTHIIVTGIEQPSFDFRPNGASLVERDQRGYLEEAGHIVFTVRPGYPDVNEDYHEIHLPSVKLPRAENYRIAWPFDPLTQLRLESWLRTMKPDLIYLHGPYQIAEKLAAIAKKLDIPYILHVHTHISGYVESRVPEQLWPVAKWLALGRAKRLADGAALTVFPSETYRLIFIAETGFDGPSVVFPSFIKPFKLMSESETERFNYRFRQNHLPINTEAYPGIVVHSRLEEEKNPEYPMRCFIELLDFLGEFPITRVVYPVLIYVGGGTPSCKARLVKIATENGILDKVYFAGSRSNEEAKKIIQTGNQNWFFSNKDTQGIVPFEAGYAKKPVFGLKKQPFDEFFGKKKFMVVSDNNPFGVAMNSHLLLSDRGRHAEMATHCHEVAVAFSDTERYSTDFLIMCEEVISQHKCNRN